MHRVSDPEEGEKKGDVGTDADRGLNREERAQEATREEVKQNPAECVQSYIR